MVAAGDGGGAATQARSLQDTPTWALATVCFLFISLSIIIEHLIQIIHNWLKRRRKMALFEAVVRLKSVLMLLGLMSLVLAVTQRPISKICIPTKVASTMLPCHSRASTSKTFEHFSSTKGAVRNFEGHLGRNLASESGGSSDYCAAKGMTSLISQDGISQLNVFIFVLAVMQIIYSVLTMALGRAKMRRWRAWEKETQTVEYLVSTDPSRFRYTRDTTFGRRHMNSCTKTSVQLWIKCFFRQFFSSVAKVDYLTLRHGFIAAHMSTNNSFNFHKYIQRSLEDDFKVIVGISPFMWFTVVIFFLVDAHGWHVYFWVSFVPLIVVLALGTKLEVIVARMALQIKSQNSVIKGAPLVQPNDNLFWFRRPKYALKILHFTLFLNSFEVAFFVWVTWQFGINSCYHEHKEIIITRIVLALSVQVICSYITLPLYAVVTQMGSQFKSTVLDEQTAEALKQWHVNIRQKRKKEHGSSSRSPPDSFSPSNRSNNQTACHAYEDGSSHNHSSKTADGISTHCDSEIIEDSQQCIIRQEQTDSTTISLGIEMPAEDHQTPFERNWR